jgi:hypothetical protein
MAEQPPAKWIAPDNLTEEQIEEGRRALENLIRLLARASAEAFYKLGFEPDMNDPEVARDVMKATSEGLFYSAPGAGPSVKVRSSEAWVPPKSI